jgi:hypothetical protein
MENPFRKWARRHQEKSDAVGAKEIDLEDVPPEHPEDYPARRLKERLDARREELDDIENGPKGMPEGPGGF